MRCLREGRHEDGRVRVFTCNDATLSACLTKIMDDITDEVIGMTLEPIRDEERLYTVATGRSTRTHRSLS